MSTREDMGGFNLVLVMNCKRVATLWVDYEGRALQPSDPPPRAEEVATHCPPDTHVGRLAFRDPNNFVAGQIHKCSEEWEQIAPDSREGIAAVDWVKNAVGLGGLFRPFKGNFQGKSYDSAFPPSAYFKNSGVTIYGLNLYSGKLL